MTQEKLIIFLMFLLLLELLCMRYFWLRSEKDEEEIKRLKDENDRLEREKAEERRACDAAMELLDRARHLVIAESEGRLIILDKPRTGHPCDGCGTGWGSANSERIETCHETCVKLAAWNEQQKKEADHAECVCSESSR